MSYNLKDLIQQLADRGDELYCVLGTVISINEEDHTCDVARVDGNADLLGVRLGLGDNPAIKIKPSLNSLVICAMLSKYDACVVMYSQVDEIQLIGKENGGLVKVKELYARLDAIESNLSDLITSHNNHTHSGGILAGGLTGTITVEVSDTTGTTDQSKLENIAIVH